MLAAVRLWILLSALLVGAGWILSALHQLNRAGYGIVFIFAGIAGIYWCKINCRPSPELFLRAVRKLFRRLKRPLPLLFLTLALMSLIGGALYVSTDGDSMSYRIPRVLHWLGAERWHWIRTTDQRMNIAGCGFEWLTAPLLLFTGTDRFLFLINWISYLLLPGLIFSVFTRLQVRPRVAWWWMWLLSSGWCYVMQAGALHNDSFAVIYALAAVDFALRARAGGRISDLWLSMFAAGLLTGTKQTAIPLALLWLIAAWPGLKLLFARPAASGVIAVFSLLVSALPMILFDLHHVGTWTGVPVLAAQPAAAGSVQLYSPFWGIIGNAFCLPVQNLLPPFFPWADDWNGAMRSFLQTSFGSHFNSFERFGFLAHSVSESSAGIGLGICVLVLVSFCEMCRRRPGQFMPARLLNWYLWSLRMAPFILLLLFMAKVGTFQNARQLAPYYVFFFPILLVNPVHIILSRKRWWQRLGFLVMLATAMMLVISRGRPLFPAETILAGLQKKYPHSEFLSKTRSSYAFRLSFEKQRDIFKKTIPPGESVIGYAVPSGGSEVGLWLPFGNWRVERVLPEDTPEQSRAQGIHYIAIGEQQLEIRNETIGQWANRYNGDLIDQISFQKDPFEPQTQLTHLYLVHLH